MPINLLKHKSYHVYNAQNIERVKRDEAEARLKQEEEERQRAKAEREERLGQLRARRQHPERKSEGNGLERAGIEKHNESNIGEAVKKEFLGEENGDVGFTETTNVFRGSIVSLLTGGTKKARQDSYNDNQSSTFSNVLQQQGRSKSWNRGSNLGTHDRHVKSSLDPLAEMEKAVLETKAMEDEAERAAAAAKEAKDRRELERRRHRHRDGHRHSQREVQRCRSSGERSFDRKRPASLLSRHHLPSTSRISKESRHSSSSRSSRSK